MLLKLFILEYGLHLLVCSLVLAVSAYFLFPFFADWMVDDQSQVERLGLQAVSTADNRQFAEAEVALTALLATGELDARREAITKRKLAISQFLQGGQVNQLKAITLMKEVVTDETYPADQRGGTATALVELYYADPSPWLLRQSFSGEPFEHLYQEADGDDELALLLAAEYADSLYPNPFSQLLIASWYSRKLLENDALATTTHAYYRNQIVAATNNAAALEAELTEPFDEFLVAHHRAINLAVLELDNPHPYEFQPEFEAEFGKAFNLAHWPGRPARVEAILPFTYFYYAVFFNEIYGAEKADVVDATVSDLLTGITGDVEPESNQFLQFVESERTTAVDDRSYNYRFLVGLAERSDEFRAFLIDRGWEI